MEVVAVIFGIVLLAVVMYKIGYSFSKRNMITHLIQQKMITSEQYTQLEEEDI